MSNAASRRSRIEIGMGEQIPDALKGLAEVEREMFRVFFEKTAHV
jgi:hypothetical protein